MRSSYSRLGSFCKVIYIFHCCSSSSPFVNGVTVDLWSPRASDIVLQYAIWQLSFQAVFAEDVEQHRKSGGVSHIFFTARHISDLSLVTPLLQFKNNSCRSPTIPCSAAAHNKPTSPQDNYPPFSQLITSPHHFLLCAFTHENSLHHFSLINTIKQQIN